LCKIEISAEFHWCAQIFSRDSTETPLVQTLHASSCSRKAEKCMHLSAFAVESTLQLAHFLLKVYMQENHSENEEKRKPKKENRKAEEKCRQRKLWQTEGKAICIYYI
jgi:hypothetical protein